MMQQKKTLKLLTLLFALSSAFFFIGCEDDSAEDAAEEMGDAMEEGAEATKDAMEDGADAVKDATN